MFPNADGELLDPGNYRNQVLKPLAEALELPKLTLQVLRRTMATRAQNLDSVKDIQAHLWHSRADTTANEYMQRSPRACNKWSERSTQGSPAARLTSSKAHQQQGSATRHGVR